MHCHVWVSQILIVVSEDPLASSPFEFHATDVVPLVCPSKVLIHFHVFESQILIMLSPDPLANLVPWEFHAMEFTQCVCSSKV